MVSIFISTSDAFQSYHYPYSSRYGVPSRPVVFKPLEDLNIPEQGPIAIIPEEARRVPSLISSSYGVPSKPPVFKPIEDLNIPEQGPAIVAPNLNSIGQVPISSSNYGVPKPRPPPVLKPIEDLNLPEQGPVLLVPEGRQIELSPGYGVPAKPVTIAPITDLDIPNEVPDVIVPPEASRNVELGE